MYVDRSIYTFLDTPFNDNEDFYTRYEINGYTKATDRLFAVYSELHKNIIDVFHEHDLDPTSSHFIKMQEVKS